MFSAFSISSGYQISINSPSILINSNLLFLKNRFRASVNSYSPLTDKLILFICSNISEENLNHHKFARFQIKFIGFSTISRANQLKSVL
jgi:hypothetical protein